MTDKEIKLIGATEDKTKIRIPKMNTWMIVSIALLVILIGTIIVYGTGITGMFVSSNSLKPEEAGVKAIKFINDNLVAPNTTASFVSTSEFEGIYNVTVSYQERNISVFLTKDGSFMFLSSPLNITQQLPTPTQQTQQPTETPKTDKPTVQLYVMAFCPYGTQAEQAMKPVVDLLGSKADIQVHFIASVSGTTADTVQSLHGPVEAQEDLRQVCIMKNYDQKTYWKYVMTIDNTCVSKYSDATAYDACWKSAAKNASIDATKINTCATGSEGVSLLKSDADLSNANGVSGSPTLIINGYVDGTNTCNSNTDCIIPGQTCVQVSSSGKACMISRNSDAFKQAICSAFTTAPSECSQTLSATGTAASGCCG